MAVIQTHRDGRYAWRCEDCGRPRLEMAHRGPRKSACKACQNKRYRCLRGDALRERNRYRMRLRRTVPGRGRRQGTIAGPEQRCFPLRALPSLWKGWPGSLPAGIATPTGIVPPVLSLPGKPCPLLPLCPRRKPGTPPEPNRMRAALSAMDRPRAKMLPRCTGTEFKLRWVEYTPPSSADRPHPLSIAIDPCPAATDSLEPLS